MTKQLAFVAAVFLFFSFSAAAQTSAGSITGRVIDASGRPVTDVTVTLVELRREARVNAQGEYSFGNVPPGHYHIAAESRRGMAAVGEVQLAAGATQQVEITIDPAIHTEEIVVSASPDTRRESEVYQPVNVVTDEELQAQLQPTLGETLSAEPGVNSTYFGPGSSRPVIRGLGADRIRVLEDGVGTGDASNVSPDHAVSVDPASAEQIEIVRGPATLLYGSNAVGGVVNVIGRRIPRSVPTQPVTGRVDLRGGTVADERNGSLTIDGGSGTFAWHADFSTRDTGDYQIPGPAEEHEEGEEEEEETDEHEGILENSSLDSQSATLGASWVNERGYIGVAATLFETNYGIPGEAHGEGAHKNPGALQEEEHHVRIDLEQQRFDVQGELRPEAGFFRSVRLRLGTTDYEHVELENDEVGTLFTNNAWETRLEAGHRELGRFTGTFGVQLSNNDFAAIGAEAFIPPNETDARAVFVFEEMRTPAWDFQFGARWENQDVSALELPSRSFNGISSSLGVIFRPVAGYAVAASLARADRLPTAQELYAGGPHLATGQFEIGDVTLDEETSTGIDLSLRKLAGRIRGELNFFRNQFDGFIFDRPTGEEEDGLPVFRFTQADARFRGLELDTHTEVWHSGANHLELEIAGDLVRATLVDGGNLPRIPPARVSIGLRFRGDRLSASAEARRYSEQQDVAEFETPTEGYTLMNATLGYRFFFGNTIHDVLLRGTNLTDQLARNHVSPLKERAPLPGRDFTLSYRLAF